MRSSGMPWQPPHHERGKAVLLVAALHLAIGAALIAGLAGEPLRQAASSLATFDVMPPPPPPPQRPEPRQEDAAKDEAGETDLAAKPAPVVLPPPAVRLPVAAPLPTADDSAPDTGAAPSAGAGAVDGSGRGAGGTGSGTGGGGSGGSGAGGLGSNARLLSGNLTRRDYRQIRSFGAPRGQATLAIEVDASGRLNRCMPLSSSGNPALDATLCTLLSRTRWEPARDLQGRAVSVALRYVATWDRD